MTGGSSVAGGISRTPVRFAPARTGSAGIDSPLPQGSSTVNIVCSAVPGARDEADVMRTAPAGADLGSRGAPAASGRPVHERIEFATGCARTHGLGNTARAGGIGFVAVSPAAATAGPFR